MKRLNPCFNCCAKFVQALPVIFILLIVGWSYYAYVYSLCVIVVPYLALKICYIIIYHILLILFLWSYLKAILELPKAIPPEFFLTEDDWKLLRNVNQPDVNASVEQIIASRDLPINMVNHDGKINVCLTCGLIKPDRAHHCSTCQKCVLKMDHHCVWTNNCVGHHNHKYFVVFLSWGTIYCLYIAATSAPFFANFWAEGATVSVDHFQLLFVFIVSLMFGICQAALGGYHVYLIAHNQTTLETFTAPKFRNGTADSRAFDLGRSNNLRETFGSNCFLAILPVPTTQGDGARWNTRFDVSDVGAVESGRGVTPLLKT